MQYEPFPLITFKKTGGTTQQVDLTANGWSAATIPKKVKVHSNPILSRLGLLTQAIDLAKEGSVVLWIENTVDEAQEAYNKAAASLPTESVGLLHSRFIRKNRNDAEELWINRLGKGGNREGCLLISTQVCEQSIDIDADILFTSLCPSDMMLQRVGRMWRHRGNDVYRKLTDPELYWFGPDQTLLDQVDACSSENTLRTIRKAWGKSSYVYDLYTLCRTAEVWLTLTEVSIPDDMRLILEKTYA